MTKRFPITVAYGDGIGPEIMAATLKILAAAEAPLDIDTIEVGEAVYRSGISTGIADSAWESIAHSKVLFKAPITTPQGGGYKSLNVTIRKTLGLYANVRPCKSLYPYVHTNHRAMDLIVIRENEEDLYTGIEYRPTQDAYTCLKLFTRPGCERIIRYAFEYARNFNRKKVTCLSKDNIMKMTDGLFHRVFNEIAEQYPDIENEHYIIDIGTARLATDPENFDVIVTANLYGDIVSDITAELVGSVGLAGSSNIGKDYAMFEAIHGSAPDIAGKGVANPSGLINAAVLMLVHLGLPQLASKIENAWLATIEAGIHTSDIYSTKHSRHLASTNEFADAVIARLGQTPERFKSVELDHEVKPSQATPATTTTTQAKRITGMDIFIEDSATDPANLATRLKPLAGPFELTIISNRGVKVWPGAVPHSALGDLWHCRFELADATQSVDQQALLDLMARVVQAGCDCVQTQTLQHFDSDRGYTLIQGQ